ncbi:MAG: ABC transporter ATP-binding protein [Bryobacterales bacterium]|nr:ABC transporter ATP-binding protein [Bryobacterales bacterium]
MSELTHEHTAYGIERQPIGARIPAAAVVNELTKRYGITAALRGVSLEIGSGEIFGLLGPNGAGKTTLVEIMEGLRQRSTGEVRVLGLDPQADCAELRQRIGVVLQDTRLHDKIRISEAMRLFASTYRNPAPWEPILQRFELWDRRNDAYLDLSGGLKQRLAIALALINDPELIFMDEPTVGLDPQARRDLQQLILRLRSERRTVILTTHYVDEAEKLCDRIALLDHGKVVTCGTPAELRRQADRESIVRITFSRPVRVPASELLHEEERHAVLSDDELSLSLLSANSWKTLGWVTHLARLSGAEIVDLEVTRPSLEDAVLFLLGKEKA